MVGTMAGPVMPALALLDGPCQGQRVGYHEPLPAVLVVATRTPAGPRWHDYRREGVSIRYSHSQGCKCHG